MNAIVTLIAPRTATLDEAVVQTAKAALVGLGADAGAPDWLATGTACDLPFGNLAPEQAEAAIRHALNGATLDIVAQPAATRRKRLLVADMESTIIEQEMLDELGDYVGLKDHIAAITARAMNGEIDFKDAVRERVALLKGLKETVIDEVWQRATLMPGAAQLVGTMRANGAACVLVSGGFRCFTGRVRSWIGFDDDRGNELEVIDGVMTGKVIEPILDKDSKLQALMAYAGEHRVPMAETMAVGDGANDLPMLLAAGLGVAFHAKAVVAAEARARVDHGDLTALLYAQGYRAAEFVG
ncbi:phosphoserine phosphatase [Azospirillum sp. TSH7]|uniref:phosphoserine phosphatase SerB n=1 Tax=unclassified Azospirillum TaxID=2630922 RepID=UPI000D622440|nr:MULTISPECIES: phosphoserine phosphatase SerB [unclassified Azospirillum]PWC66743.1 phosphoserine phosphatase [Azospirillum sp. TSH7]PWC70606.1 phosphoserine phosphatase [Azospirillum sp. TSH20]